jgi:hypothetical protein
MHTESNVSFPSLFEKSIVEKERELIPVVLLAFGMDLPVDKTNPVTGETFKAVGFTDEFGMTGNWVNLGKNVFQAVKNLAISDADSAKIENLVGEKLRTDYLHNERKATLKKSISQLVNTQILALCGNNDLDAQFNLYKSAAAKIMQTKLVEK